MRECRVCNVYFAFPCPRSRKRVRSVVVCYCKLCAKTIVFFFIPFRSEPLVVPRKQLFNVKVSSPSTACNRMYNSSPTKFKTPYPPPQTHIFIYLFAHFRLLNLFF